MTAKRLYWVLLGLIGLLVVALLGGAYGVDRLVSTQQTSLVNNRLQVAVLDEEESELARAKQDVKKYQDLATIAKNVVPQDKDQAQTVSQIVELANDNGITLSSITFPSSELGTKGSTTQTSQLTPVPGMAGVYSLQLTVQSDPNKPVAYSKFISFLSALEHNRRTALVSSITILPNDKDRSTLSFTLILDEYIKP